MNVAQKTERIAHVLDDIGDARRDRTAPSSSRRVFQQRRNAPRRASSRRAGLFARRRRRLDAGHCESGGFGFDEKIAVAAADLQQTRRLWAPR